MHTDTAQRTTGFGRPAATAPIPGGRSLAKLLVATDGGPHSDAALVLGSVIAQRAQAAMDVLTTYQWLPRPPAEPAELAEAPELERMLRDDLRERVLCQLVRAGVPVAPEHLLLRTGHPGETVVRTAEETGAQLIVLGLRPHGLAQRVFGPETALHVVHTARVPVLAVANRLRWLPPRAVVAVDFSESSARAVHTAIDLLGTGGGLVLVHVAPRSSVPFDASAAWQESPAGGLADRLHSFEHGLRIPAGLTVEHVILLGDPAAEILALTARAHAELIVTGSHGRSAAGRALLGSVATALLRNAGCSVLVAPAVRG